MTSSVTSLNRNPLDSHPTFIHLQWEGIAYEAFKKNDLETLETVHKAYGLDKFKPHPETKETLIHQVDLHTRREIIDFLLSAYEGQLGLRDQFDHTPAHLAAEKGNIDLLRLYASKGADFKAVNRNGESILFDWVLYRTNLLNKQDYFRNLDDGIDFLLSQGIDINQPDNNGYSVLDRARSASLDPRIEALLLARGAISTKPVRNYSSGAVPPKA